jgi:hypothetical protein
MKNLNEILEELDKYKIYSNELKQEIIKKEEEISVLVNSNNDMTSILSQLQTENNYIKKELINAKSENEELKEKNNLLEEQINNINIQHQKELNSIKNIIQDNSLKESNNIESLLKIKEEEIKTLKNEISRIRQEKDLLELNYQNLKNNFSNEINKIKLNIQENIDINNIGVKIENNKINNDILEEVLKELNKKKGKR